MAEKLTIVVHSGDMDKIYSALIIATGALSMGMQASLYFTFWGLQRLQKGGLEKGSLSKMHMLGIGKSMMKQRMNKANVSSLERLMQDFKELGGKIIACDMTMQIIIACDMTMQIMGIKKEDLREDLITEYGAVGTYIQEARESTINLFI